LPPNLPRLRFWDARGSENLDEKSVAEVHAASAVLMRVGQEAVDSPLGIHDSRRRGGQVRSKKSKPSHGQAEGLSVI
jgi:hypothetical protein